MLLYVFSRRKINSNSINAQICFSYCLCTSHCPYIAHTLKNELSFSDANIIYLVSTLLRSSNCKSCIIRNILSTAEVPFIDNLKR